MASAAGQERVRVGRYRWAIFGLVAGAVYLLTFSRIAGMALWWRWPTSPSTSC